MLFQVMRNFVSAMERPGWILAISTAGIPLNALVSWSMIFGHLGMPRFGLIGGGIGSSVVWFAMAIALAIVVLVDRRSAVSNSSADFGGLTGRVPPAVQARRADRTDDGFEGGVFSAAAYFDGFVRRAFGGGAPDCAANRGHDLHGAPRAWPGGNRSRRLGLRSA
jgi:MATE family multidrug resistance protein